MKKKTQLAFFALFILTLVIVIGFVSFVNYQSTLRKTAPAIPLQAKTGLASFMMADKAATKVVDRDFSTSKTILANLSNPIFGLSISGSSAMNSYDSVARVVLIDVKGKEYLVYDHASFKSIGSFQFKNFCEETCILDAVTPLFIRVELYNATININSIQYIESQESLNAMLQGKSASEYQLGIIAAQQAYKIDELNNENKRQGMTWIAGATSVSGLSYENKKKLFSGQLPNLQGFEYYKSGVFELRTSKKNNLATGMAIFGSDGSELPINWDWRAAHGKNYMTSVKSQKAESCWVYATAAALEAYINTYYNQKLDIDISEMDILFCSEGESSITGKNEKRALEYIKNEGVSDSTSTAFDDQWEESMSESGGLGSASSDYPTIQELFGDSGKTRVTHYYTSYEGDFGSWAEFADSVLMQGSGITTDDRMCSYTSVYEGRESCIPVAEDPEFSRGITSMGTNPTPHQTIASDPSLPLGTTVEIDYGEENSWNGCYIIEDRGSMIVGNHVDLYVGVGLSELEAASYLPSHADIYVTDGSCGASEQLLDMGDVSADNMCLYAEKKWSIGDYARMSLSAGESLQMFDNRVKYALVHSGPLALSISFGNSGHAVAVAGYSSNGESASYIIKNSWGAGWGVEGYGMIRMNEESKDDFVFYSILGIIRPEGTALQAVCEDKDQDGYCNWGTGIRPDVCDIPDESRPLGCNQIGDSNDNDSQVTVLVRWLYPTAAETFEQVGCCVHIDGTCDTFLTEEGCTARASSGDETKFVPASFCIEKECARAGCWQVASECKEECNSDEGETQVFFSSKYQKRLCENNLQCCKKVPLASCNRQYAVLKVLKAAYDAHIIDMDLSLDAVKRETQQFADVPEESDYYDLILIARHYGIARGYGDNTFKPENQFTRAEVVSMVVNAFFKTEFAGTSSASMQHYADLSQEHWAFSMIEFSRAIGLFSGYKEGDVFLAKPDQIITCGELETFIERAKYLRSQIGEAQKVVEGSQIAQWFGDAAETEVDRNAWVSCNDGIVHHHGIDLVTKEGTQNLEGAQVHAYKAGTITDIYKQATECSTSGNLAGNYVAIQAGDGAIYRYLHLKEGSIPESMQIGDEVDEGEVIGRIGNTGTIGEDCNFYHLHLDKSIMPGSSTCDSFVNPFTGALLANSIG